MVRRWLSIITLFAAFTTPANATEWILCGDAGKKVSFDVLVGLMDYLVVDTVRIEANGKKWSTKEEEGAAPIHVAQAFDAGDHMMIDINEDGGSPLAKLRVFDAHEDGAEGVEPVDVTGGILHMPGIGAWVVNCSGP